MATTAEHEKKITTKLLRNVLCNFMSWWKVFRRERKLIIEKESEEMVDSIWSIFRKQMVNLKDEFIALQCNQHCDRSLKPKVNGESDDLKSKDRFISASSWCHQLVTFNIFLIFWMFGFRNENLRQNIFFKSYKVGALTQLFQKVRTEKIFLDSQPAKTSPNRKAFRTHFRGPEVS